MPTANKVTTISTTNLYGNAGFLPLRGSLKGRKKSGSHLFLLVNRTVSIHFRIFPCLYGRVVLYSFISKGSDKIFSLPLHIRNIDSVFKSSYFGKPAERRRRKARWV